MERSNRKTYLLGAAFLLLLMGVTFFLILRENAFASLLPVIRSANPWFLLCGLACVFLFITCEGLNIRLLMGSMGRKIRLMDSVKYAFVGFYFSAITPSASGGQPMQVYFMRREEHPVPLSALAFLVIGGVYQTAMLCFGGAMFLLKGRFLAANVGGIQLLFFYGAAVNLFLISLLFLLVFQPNLVRRAAEGAVGLLCRLRIVKRRERAIEAVERQIGEYRQGVRHIKRNPGILFGVFLVTVVQLTAFYSVPFFVYHALGMSGHSYLELIATECILMIAVSSLPLPGAVGASEVSFLSVFAVFFGGKIVPAMLLSRGVSFYFFLAVSGVVAAVTYLRVSGRRKTEGNMELSEKKG